MPSEEKKVKFQIILSFPSEDCEFGSRILNDCGYSPPRESYCFLVCLVACPGDWLDFLPAWDTLAVSFYKSRHLNHHAGDPEI